MTNLPRRKPPEKSQLCPPLTAVDKPVSASARPRRHPARLPRIPSRHVANTTPSPAPATTIRSRLLDVYARRFSLAAFNPAAPRPVAAVKASPHPYRADAPPVVSSPTAPLPSIHAAARATVVGRPRASTAFRTRVMSSPGASSLSRESRRCRWTPAAAMDAVGGTKVNPAVAIAAATGANPARDLPTKRKLSMLPSTWGRRPAHPKEDTLF